MAQKHKSAFTLVEVLIVILIIGILAGLIMLSSGSATDTAERTRCVADRRSLRSALYIFRVEKGGTTSADLSATLKEVLDKMFDNGQGTVSGDSEIDGICPSKGIYAVTISDDKYLIACSVHGGDGTGTGSGGSGTGGDGGGTGGDGGGGTGGGTGSGDGDGKHYLYETGILIKDGNYWASIHDFENFYKPQILEYPMGTVIKIGDDCYFAISNVKMEGSNNPATSYLHEGGFLKISSNAPQPWSGNGTEYYKGHLYQYNGNYYMSKTNTSNPGIPGDNNWAWIKINQ